ncbi:hypothetical protein SNE40_015405 [Patella caerulea]|uniref:Uncharacterized protein n=1 Tax=Patella caerulea TaxID=87958 RepID=A0AAN8JJY6_PATCE
MDESGGKKVVSLKSLTTEETITLQGPSEFTVGLTTDEKLSWCQRWAEESDICLPLFVLTIWQTEGSSLTPSTKDLPCLINEEAVTAETNLIAGSKIEIGDKLLEFIDGPIPRHRRHLPPTPGVHVRNNPPDKPTRSPEENSSPDKVVKELVLSDEERLSEEWCLAHPPSMEEELICQLQTPEQIANLSASYLNRQVHLFTDTKLNPILVDQIFKTFQDVAVHRRDILETFLREFAKELADTPEEEKGKPFHTPIIYLLVEILKQFLDPLSHVVLCLQLLRAISHVPDNLSALIYHQSVAAILGSMTAYLDKTDVQQFGLDILVKIATFKPDITEKPPLHEGGIEVISLSVQHHAKNLTIVQSGCRVLSNLSTTLYDTASQVIDDDCECNVDILQGLDKFLVILDTISWSCTSIIQEAMKNFSTDLGVNREGRRFMYVFARLPHLKQRKSQWYEQSLENDLKNQLSDEEREEDEPLSSILKRTRSFENLRTPERKVQFDEEDDFLSSVSSTVSDTSTIADESGIEVCSRVFYDPHTGKALDSDSLLDITQKTKDSLEMGDHSKHINGISDKTGENNESVITDTIKKDIIDKREVIELRCDKLSKSDIQILNKLLKSVIVCHVCSLAFDGEEAVALKLIGQPIREMFTNNKFPQALLEFVKNQYKEEITLMDLDPSVAISVIDAVRYRSVAYELIQGSIKSVVKLFEKSPELSTQKLSCQFISDCLIDERLSKAVEDATFCKELKKYLLLAISKVGPNTPVDEVLTHVINLHIKVQQKSTEKV